MTASEFWQIIDVSRHSSGGDGEALVDAVRDALLARQPAEIVALQQTFDELRARSYQRRLWGAASLLNGGCSDDGFEYFRAWLIGQGQRVYDAALADPDSLADVLARAEEPYELESLMYVAAEAYEALAGEPIPRSDFEFPELTGDEWTEDELEALFPRIAAALRRH